MKTNNIVNVIILLHLLMAVTWLACFITFAQANPINLDSDALRLVDGRIQNDPDTVSGKGDGELAQKLAIEEEVDKKMAELVIYPEMEQTRGDAAELPTQDK